MINPTHRLKKFVKYAGNEKPATFYVTDAVGWLGSGVKDCNGQEMRKKGMALGSAKKGEKRYVGCVKMKE